MRNIVILALIPFAILGCMRSQQLTDEELKESADHCDWMMKETGAGVLFFRMTHGRYPVDLPEVIDDNPDVSDFNWKCPAAKGEAYYIYHKPPEGAPPDFVFLECSHHLGHKWALRNIGGE